ncbi:hypothetical protein QBC46DRAFT_352601 [Diplogelasinospora grovesii]|uniref:Zn(2)-C6 fungal-type domain-containing protein n=1 Tax=Diplogelasinospora grovesii TaxID=303347 RepID=A0AAN6NBI3_9PEZI|nr:hypothetical protein QBC46DRAFT_352601 [Diplogelasinospora grovesii]
MDPGGQPAGFFSTFSIFDPDNSTHEGFGRTQRRNRRVYVCIPCHRRKLKCDKGQPCSRCVQSGSADDCVYQPLPSENSERETETSCEPEDDSTSRSHTQQGGFQPGSPGSARSEGRTVRRRLHGTTHWRTIACEFEEAWPYIIGSNPQWEPRYRQLQELEYLFPSHSGVNFPLGSVCLYSHERRQVLESLPPRPIVEALVRCYFQAFEPTHRLLHSEQFADELSMFWINSDQVAEDWLAQLCMMLALGSRAASGHVFTNSGRSAGDWIDFFLDAAQFFFGRSPYFASPTLTTVRTLCMTVISRMTEIIKGSEPNQIIPLMGFVSRLAMSMQLHRTASLFPTMSVYEAEMRKGVWITVQLLDLHVALKTGTSYIYRNQDTDAPLNLNDADFHRSVEQGWMIGNDRQPATHETLTDSTFQIKLGGILPMLVDIANRVNSPTQPPFDSEQTRRWDGQLRQKLRDAESVLLASRAIHGHGQPDNTLDKATTQVHFLRVLIHRCLLALHHAHVGTRGSQITLIRSSLSILRIQQLWHAASNSSRNRSGPGAGAGVGLVSEASSPLLVPCASNASPEKSVTSPASTARNYYLIDLCRDDFGAAMLYLLLALRNQQNYNTLQQQENNLPARQVAYAILRQSLGFVKERACQSVLNFREFLGLSIALGCLEGLETGGPSALLSRLEEVAGQVEQTILAEKQDMLWMESGNPPFMQVGLSPGVHTVPFGFGHGQQ